MNSVGSFSFFFFLANLRRDEFTPEIGLTFLKMTLTKKYTFDYSNRCNKHNMEMVQFLNYQTDNISICFINKI